MQFVITWFLSIYTNIPVNLQLSYLDDYQLSVSAKENFGSRKGTGPIEDGEEFRADTDNW